MVTLAYEMEIAYRQQQIARDVRLARGAQVGASRARRRGPRWHLPAIGLTRHRSA